MQAPFPLFGALNVPYRIIELLHTNRHRELLSERPWVRIPPGTPANTPKTFDLSGFSAFLISAAFVAFLQKNLGLLTFANEIWPFAKKGGKSEVRFLPKELANIC